jgi:hypothetical protein
VLVNSPLPSPAASVSNFLPPRVVQRRSDFPYFTSDDGMTNKLERICKEAVVPQPPHLPGGIETRQLVFPTEIWTERLPNKWKSVL